MSQKTYSLISGLIFAFVFLIHLWRVLAGWDITIAGTTIALWVSWIGLIVTGLLAYSGLRLSAQKP